MHLPLFPLPNLVLFPGMVVPLYVFEPRYRALLADVQASGGPFGIVRILESSSTSSQPFHERVSRVGTLAHLRQANTHDDGTSTVLLIGGDRFVIEDFVLDRPYLSAEVRLWPLDSAGSGAPGQEEVTARELLSAVLRLNPAQADAIREAAPADPLLIASFAASLLPLSPEQREDILAARSVQERLDALLAATPGNARLLN